MDTARLDLVFPFHKCITENILRGLQKHDPIIIFFKYQPTQRKYQMLVFASMNKNKSKFYFLDKRFYKAFQNGL